MNYILTIMSLFIDLLSQEIRCEQSLVCVGEISGPRGGEYEDACLLGCCAVESGRSLPTFQSGGLISDDIFLRHCTLSNLHSANAVRE
jgi:hypothetical protein